jgi:hypothetical protein
MPVVAPPGNADVFQDVVTLVPAASHQLCSRMLLNYLTCLSLALIQNEN